MSFLGRRLRASSDGVGITWVAPLDTSIWEDLSGDTGSLTVSGDSFVWTAGDIGTAGSASMIYETIVGPDDINILQNQDYDMKFGVERTISQNPATGTAQSTAQITVRGLRNLDKSGPIDSLSGTQNLFDVTSVATPVITKESRVTTTVTTGPEFVGFLLRLATTYSSTDGGTCETIFDMLNGFTISVSTP